MKKGDLVLLVPVDHADSVDLDTVDLGYELQYRRAVGIALVTGAGRHQLKADAARTELGQPGRDVTLHPAHLPKSALSADDSSRIFSDGQTRAAWVRAVARPLSQLCGSTEGWMSTTADVVDNSLTPSQPLPR